MNASNRSRSRNQAPFYQIVGALILLILTFAVGGSSILWLRQQVAATAANTQRLQRELAQVQRRQQFLDNKIAEVHSPEVLLRRASQAGLKLQAPKPLQVVRLTPPRVTPAKTVQPSSRSLVAPTTQEPFKRSLDLAILETPPKP